LTWTAPTVTKNDSVTYQALVLTGASDLPQPLTNTATISSEETQPDSSTSDVFVSVTPLGETNVPTPPPTDALAPGGSSSQGSGLLLVLALLGVLVVGLGFFTPVPSAVRRRIRR
jgi:hypothetical protein